MLFNGRDLSGATLGDPHHYQHQRSTPFMDLSGAVMRGCNLSHSPLEYARLDQVCLDHVELDGACLEGVRFGQSPMLLGHTSTVTGLAIARNPDHQLDAKWVFSFSGVPFGDGNNRKWSLESGECWR